MSIDNLPASIQNVIQTGMLERKFRQPLTAKLGFRAIADKEKFGAGMGETITKTRTGLLPVVDKPIANPANTDITSGLTPKQWGVEQFTMGLAMYADTMNLNVVTSKVAIADLYLRNAWTQGEQAMRSVDSLARNALYGAYLGGQTRVRVTLGAAGASVQVDDCRGFFATLNSAGTPVAVSALNPVVVTINGNAYSLIATIADGSAPAGGDNPWEQFITYSNAGNNVTTTPGGKSGTLMFSTNVSTADGTAANSVISAVAPLVVRPSATTTPTTQHTNTSQISSANDINSGRLTMQMILQAKATMSANAVPPVESTGLYHVYADPIHLTGLYQDPAFQQFFRGQIDSSEYKKGVVAELLGVRIEETNLNPVQTLAGVGTVRRALLAGQGALVESDFTGNYASANNVDDGNLTTVVEGIAHITREPLDALKQVVTTSWCYMGGFVAPTDTTANPSVLPTATNSAYKRCAMLESL